MKSYAIRMKLQADRRLMSINLEAGRVQRQMRNLQSRIKTQQRYENMRLQYTLQGNLAPLQQQLSQYQATGDTANMNSVFSAIQSAQMDYSMQKQYSESYWDAYMEQHIEPLKDEEERLQQEKLMAEQEQEFWKATVETYTQKNKDDIKSVVPDAG